MTIGARAGGGCPGASLYNFDRCLERLDRINLVRSRQNLGVLFHEAICRHGAPSSGSLLYPQLRTSTGSTNRQSGLISNPSLHSWLAQKWCPLRLRTRSSPHSAQTAGICGHMLYSSTSMICFQKSRRMTGGVSAREVMPRRAALSF